MLSGKIEKNQIFKQKKRKEKKRKEKNFLQKADKTVVISVTV
jgi:hypothetical protein